MKQQTLIVAYAVQKVNDVDGCGSEYQPFSDIPFWTAYDAQIRAYSNNLGQHLFALQAVWWSKTSFVCNTSDYHRVDYKKNWTG